MLTWSERWEISWTYISCKIRSANDAMKKKRFVFLFPLMLVIENVTKQEFSIMIIHKLFFQPTTRQSIIKSWRIWLRCGDLGANWDGTNDRENSQSLRQISLFSSYDLRFMDQEVKKLLKKCCTSRKRKVLNFWRNVKKYCLFSTSTWTIQKFFLLLLPILGLNFLSLCWLSWKIH